MAFSPDLNTLNTTLQDLSPDLVIAGEKACYLFEWLRTKGAVNKSSIAGTFWGHDFSTGASNVLTPLYLGNEVAPLGTSQNILQYQVQSYRFMAPISITGLSLSMNKGKQGIVKLIEGQPKATFAALYRSMNRWLLSADVTAGGFASAPALDGLATLNGQHVGTSLLGVNAGLLSFAAPGAQTAVTQNVAKNFAQEHYNQYGDVASFAADNLATPIRVLLDAQEFDAGRRGPDLGICDPDSFSNLITYSADTVRTSTTDQAVIGKKFFETMIGSCVVRRDTDLDRTKFTGAAADGVLYLMNTDYISMNYLEMPSPTPFTAWTPQQDVVASQIIGSMNLMFERFNCQGAVTGLASP